jgi:gliding motility-associated-like protein
MKRIITLLLFTGAISLASAQCLLTWDTTSTPGYGGVGTTYVADQTVEICLSVNTWNSASANWFHGFEIILGPGWDDASLTATVFPASCDGNGNWAQYASITSSATGASYGHGIYYDSGSGGPLDGNPGNNWGDNATCPVPHWVQFCFEVTTLDPSACIEGADLSITLNTLGDGEAGSWGSFNCNVDPNIVFSGPVLTCCEAPLFTLNNPLCPGDASGSITAVGNSVGPYTFNWDTGFTETTGDSSTVTGLAAGTYTLVMVDGDGCSSTSEYILTDPPIITFSLDTVVNVFCPGGTSGLFGVTATGGTGLGTFTYSLDGGPYQPVGFFDNLAVGTYTVTGRDANGCEADFDVTLIEENVLAAAVLDATDNDCYGDTTGSITGGASGGYPPYQYSLDGITFQVDPILTDLAAGDYVLYVQDNVGCIDTQAVSIDEPEELTLDAGEYLPIPAGTGLELTPVTNASPVASWMWTPTDYLSCSDCENPTVTPEFTTWYVLTVQDAAGCSVTDSTEIVVIRTLAIPNAFSPNADGLNDLFIIRTPYLDQFLLRIFNRWGQEVFSTQDIAVGWDGTLSGKPQEVGTYIYYLSATSLEGEPINKSGTVILVR